MATPIVSRGHASAERRFFTGMALAILATVIVGFSRSFFLRPLFPDWPSPSETIFYVHGALFTAWIVLLVAQASLVAVGRTELHRKIGPSSAVLAVAMVVLGTLGALIAARRATGVRLGRPPLELTEELEQRITTMRTRGLSLRAIAAILNADGVPPPTGIGRWHAPSVSRVAAR